MGGLKAQEVPAEEVLHGEERTYLVIGESAVNAYREIIRKLAPAEVTNPQYRQEMRDLIKDAQVIHVTE